MASLSVSGGVAPLIRALGLVVVVASLVFGSGTAARAQTIQTGPRVVALSTGNELVFGSYTVSVGTCNINKGGSSDQPAPACSTDADLYLYGSMSRGNLDLIVEAADGGAPGTGTPEAILHCVTGNSCTSGTYDLSVELDVSSTLSVTAVGQTLTGTGAPGAGGGAVYNTEDVYGYAPGTSSSTQVCFDSAFATALTGGGSSSAVCSFGSSPQTQLAITKDLGLNLYGVANNTTLSLMSVSQTLIPEPASIAVLSAALAALGTLRQRRRRV